MIAYVAVIEDSHADNDPQVFTSRETAIAHCREWATTRARRPEDYEEMHLAPYYEFYASYGPESDKVYVVARTLDDPANMPRVNPTAEEGTNLNHLPIVAQEIVRKMREAGWRGDIRPQQTLALVEEAGEFAAAARRYMGMARRTGGKQDVQAELADVVITAFVAGCVFDIDLPRAVEEKLKVIFGRPFRDPA